MIRSLPLIFLLFLGCRETTDSPGNSSLQNKSWPLLHFEKIDSLNPILQPSEALTFNCPATEASLPWEVRNVLNPAAVVKDGKVHLFYRAQDESGTSRIGLAVSTDGLHFEKNPTPVLFPDQDSLLRYEWNYRKFLDDPGVPPDCTTCYFDGVEDPRIVETEDGRYVMTYTAYDGKTARLSLAVSTDLLHWEKHGPVFKSAKYRDQWSKSGAIVAEVVAGKNLARKVAGQYWMYFGDTDIFLAASEDLIHWEIAENAENQQRISVLHPRMGYFDSRLVEPGPFALYRDEGIMLIYNGSNAANFNDPELPKFTYAAGQALFDRDLPYRLIDRTETHFIHPDKDYERVGEVNEVCFVEGLVSFEDKWLLYYGTADSKIAVAVRE